MVKWQRRVGHGNTGGKGRGSDSTGEGGLLRKRRKGCTRALMLLHCTPSHLLVAQSCSYCNFYFHSRVPTSTKDLSDKVSMAMQY